MTEWPTVIGRRLLARLTVGAALGLTQLAGPASQGQIIIEDRERVTAAFAAMEERYATAAVVSYLDRHVVFKPMEQRLDQNYTFAFQRLPGQPLPKFRLLSLTEQAMVVLDGDTLAFQTPESPDFKRVPVATLQELDGLLRSKSVEQAIGKHMRALPYLRLLLTGNPRELFPGVKPEELTCRLERGFWVLGHTSQGLTTRVWVESSPQLKGLVRQIRRDQGLRYELIQNDEKPKFGNSLPIDWFVAKPFEAPVVAGPAAGPKTDPVAAAKPRVGRQQDHALLEKDMPDVSLPGSFGEDVPLSQRIDSSELAIVVFWNSSHKDVEQVLAQLAEYVKAQPVGQVSLLTVNTRLEAAKSLRLGLQSGSAGVQHVVDNPARVAAKAWTVNEDDPCTVFFIDASGKPAVRGVYVAPTPDKLEELLSIARLLQGPTSSPPGAAASN